MMNGSAAVAAHNPELSRLLEIFVARAEAKARLVSDGDYDWSEAVDDLQADAIRDGLVDAFGQDRVQVVMAEAFKKFIPDLPDEESVPAEMPAPASPPTQEYTQYFPLLSDEAIGLGRKVRSRAGTQEAKKAYDWREGMFTAAELQQEKFSAINYVVLNIIPEGVVLLAGRPKTAKGWLYLDLALAVTGNRFTLGEIKPAQGDVLILALEDGKRRKRSRIDKLMAGFNGTWPDRLAIKLNWRRLDQGGLEDIAAWCDSVKKPTLIVVDTLARVRPPQSGKGVLYAEDTAALAGLQKLAIERGIAVLVIHHTRKQDADDVYDTISGSLGLSGVADTLLVLRKQAGNFVLHVTGRDVETAELALSFNKLTCKWSILGAASDVQRSSQRAKVIEALKEANSSLSPKEIMIAAELTSRNATDLLLFKMVKAKEIERAERGRYTLPGKNGKIDRKDTQTVTAQGSESFLSDLSGVSEDKNGAKALR